MTPGSNLCWNALVIEVEESILVHHESATSCFVLILCCFLKLFHIVVEEVVMSVPLAFNESVAV